MSDLLPLGLAISAGAIVGLVLDRSIGRLSPASPMARVTRSPRAPSSRTHPARRLARPFVVGALTSAMFAIGYRYYGPTPQLASRLSLGCALIVLFAVDLEHRLLPNAITLPGIVVGFVFSFVTEPGWVSSLLGMAIGAGSLLLVAECSYRLRRTRALGMGDVKMLAMIGAFLGWKMTLVSLMAAMLCGSFIGIVLTLAQRDRLQAALPFGTFLAVGAAIAAVAGSRLFDWYVGLW